MTINFIKLNHNLYRLEIINNDQVVYKHDLETKGFLRHDFMHYTVEILAGLKKSFFGEFKYGVDKEKSEIMVTERIVAVLQGIDKDADFSPENYYNRFKEWENIQKVKLPEYITEEFIENVSKNYFLMIKTWENMKTGEDSIMSKEY